MSLRFRGADGWHELAVRRHPRARRAKLRIDIAARQPVLVLPKRASLRRAAGWAETHRDWIETRLGALPPVTMLAPGASLPFRGGMLVIDHDFAAPRKPRMHGDRLLVGGPVEGLERRALGWLRDEARAVLESESRTLAERAGLPLARVTIGDARSRWGSCSAAGNIRYNWRLILAPPRVLAATVAHEVAHLRHMDHGAQFHALVADLFGADPAPERAWLREHGAALHQVGAPASPRT